jgi:hypothetical protein
MGVRQLDDEIVCRLEIRAAEAPARDNGALITADRQFLGAFGARRARVSVTRCPGTPATRLDGVWRPGVCQGV